MSSNTVTAQSCANIPLIKYWGSRDNVLCLPMNGYISSTATRTQVVNPFPFTGFFSPVDDPPVKNRVKVGQGILVKFSLGGDMGLSIFASGYPKSQQVACEAGATVDPMKRPPHPTVD